MRLKQKIALLLCSIMLIQPVWVTAEEISATQASDVTTSPQGLTMRRKVSGADNIWLVKNPETDWTGSGNMIVGGCHLEDSKGKWLTEEYMRIEPISGSHGLYTYFVPAGHQSDWCGVFRLKDGQVKVLAEPFTYLYRGVDAGEASFYFSPGQSGVYYDINGNPIKDLGAYLKPYGVSLERDEWADNAVKIMTDYGIMPPNLAYNYKSNITRREYCALAVNFYNANMGEYMGKAYTDTSPFTDVDDFYVSAAADLGIVSGVGNGKFEPDRPITRQEAAVLLCNLAKVTGKHTNIQKPATFADDSAIALWAKASVYEICGIRSESGECVMVGTGNKKFSPTTYYTRQQAVATIYRLNNHFEF